MPRERPRIGETREVGEVLSGADHHGGEAVTIHVLVQAGYVGDDLALRLGHGSPSASEMRLGDMIVAGGRISNTSPGGGVYFLADLLRTDDVERAATRRAWPS